MRQVAGHALVLFGIEPAALSLIEHFDNTTFKVTGRDGARYALHIVRSHKDAVTETHRRARIESELWWLDHVRTNLHLPVPVAVRTPVGERMVTIAGESKAEPEFCTLFHWVDGRFLYRRLTRMHLGAVGRLTARLHEHSITLYIPPGFDRPTVDRADTATEEFVARLFSDHFSREGAKVMRRVLQRVRQAQDDLGAGRDTFGLIHADIHQRNYLFGDGDVRLIDFGDCGWGHYLYDLGVTLHQLQALPHRGDLRDALLAGYRRIRDLSPAHEAMIGSFIMLREVQDLTFVLQERDNPAYSKWTVLLEAKVARLESRLAADG